MVSFVNFPAGHTIGSADANKEYWGDDAHAATQIEKMSLWWRRRGICEWSAGVCVIYRFGGCAHLAIRVCRALEAGLGDQALEVGRELLLEPVHARAL